MARGARPGWDEVLWPASQLAASGGPPRCTQRRSARVPDLPVRGADIARALRLRCCANWRCGADAPQIARTCAKCHPAARGALLPWMHRSVDAATRARRARVKTSTSIIARHVPFARCRCPLEKVDHLIDQPRCGKGRSGGERPPHSLRTQNARASTANDAHNTTSRELLNRPGSSLPPAPKEMTVLRRTETIPLSGAAPHGGERTASKAPALPPKRPPSKGTATAAAAWSARWHALLHHLLFTGAAAKHAAPAAPAAPQ